MEEFALCWNKLKFAENLSTGFQSLFDRGDLIDCTVACDGQLLQCHKIVLAICSPYFKEIFLNNPCQHPIGEQNEIKKIRDYIFIISMDTQVRLENRWKGLLHIWKVLSNIFVSRASNVVYRDRKLWITEFFAVVRLPRLFFFCISLRFGCCWHWRQIQFSIFSPTRDQYPIFVY